jgi:small-conductance mechanosensitive channel
MDEKLIDILDMIYKAATVVLIAYISIKVFKRVILVYLKIVAQKTENQADDILAPFLGKVITVAIWIVAFVMFLRVFGIDITVFVAGMGIIGLVIAFAAQDTLSNFFAGIMILLDRPFKEGDIIMLDDAGYEVKHIGLRSTRLFHSISNQLVTIPNNKISDHLFSNLSEPDNKGRKTVEVGTGYDNDPKRIGEILMEIANSHPDTFVDDDHQPFYRFANFGDSSLNFSLTFWVKDFNDQWRVASEIRERIYERFDREGIEIPFPQRVVHMASDKKSKERATISKPAPGDMKNLAP